MTKIQFLHTIEKYAESYSIIARKSILQDHRSEVTDISQLQVNSVLAGFVNYMGQEQGVDFGLYARDLSKNLIKPPKNGKRTQVVGKINHYKR